MLKRDSFQTVYIDGCGQGEMCDDQKGGYVKYADIKPFADRVQHSIETLEREDITDEIKIKICLNKLNEYLYEMRGSENKRKNPNR